MKRISSLFFIVLISAITFISCDISTEEQAEAAKILSIREDLLNKGDIKSFSILLTDDYPDRANYLDQLIYQRQYFSRYSYDINSMEILSVSPFKSTVQMLVDYDISFKNPDDPAETFWLGRKEEAILKKEDIGWKIALIKEIKNTGRKIDPQTVHDIFFALDTRKTALNNGDIELFKTVIDEKYPKRDQLIEDFKKNSEAFINVNYGLSGRKFQYISEKLDEARVIQYFDLVFNIKGFDKSEKIEDQREIISLKRSGDNIWKITDGLK